MRRGHLLVASVLVSEVGGQFDVGDSAGACAGAAGGVELA
jgi:hypothetical protein